MKVCALTNVYNEAFNLPIWLRHYGNQVGRENCIVIDHGSTDGSTANLGATGRVNMPREKFSNSTRALFISNFASSLLTLYDAVIYSDCDEMLVADPRKYAGLVEFCEQLSTPCATAIGLNVLHKLDEEKLVDESRNILQQRSYVQFVSPMCKSLVIKQPIQWGSGFHSSSLQPHFSDLYLFHLRWVDIVQCLRRLNITQSVEFEKTSPTHHHAAFAQYVEWFQQTTKRECQNDFNLDDCIANVVNSTSVASNGQFGFASDWRSAHLFRIPDAFRAAF